MGHTFVFVHGIVVALLSIVAATNGTIPIQSVPFTDVGVIKKEVSEAVPFDVRSEDRGLQKAWWKLIHANPEKVYKKLKLHITEQDIFKHPELEWFANYMQRYYVNQDSDLLLAKMVAKSHKDGSLMRYIEEAKVRYNTRDKTDEPEAATFIRNVERIEAGLHRYWELQRYTVKDLVDFFIQSGELSMENVKRASHFLFRKNLFTVLKAYAIKTNVEDPEKAVALAIADQVGLDNMALMIQEADNPLAIKTLTILYEDLESKKNMLSDVFYRLQLGSFELDKKQFFNAHKFFS
ncbi:RxLR-like protein [Plasmopara halstedii]|uniref:RxLR-like protein n=1 Tax=Plasmopara halstedii TaxID=4781 RepID=A0A0P1AYC3_PLAHL|nr:RxLR-like protein [Plasmopara halstedii]CEG46350.1 RxLR-like protein [Plasmopara halstedii]|eukprot:XP_024582719.1 RxLR-like protein [Plasmopara halstedii]